MDPQTLPPVPQVRPVHQADTALPPAALGGDTIDAGSVAPRGGAYAVPPVAATRRRSERSWADQDESFDVLADDGAATAATAGRRPATPTSTTTRTAPGATASS